MAERVMIGTYHGARVWCNLDICGVICVMATWAMLLYAVYVITFVVLRPTPLEECLSTRRVLTSLAFVALACLAATAHVRTMLTDPGAVPRYASPVPALDPSSREDELEEGGGLGETNVLGGRQEQEGDGEEEEEGETSRLTTGVEGGSSGSMNNRGSGHGGGGSVGGGGGGGGNVSELGRTRSGRVAVMNGAGLSVVAGGSSEDLSVVVAAGRRAQSLPQPTVKWCHKCDAFKPPRAHHCSLCQRCIVKMDHHCPWVNNCVGIGNQKLFLLFCTYTSALSACALVIMAVEMVLLGSSQAEVCQLDPDEHVYTVSLSAISIMFGLFTCCMACDQCQVVSTNQTKIDRLKGEVHESTGDANEVFGGDEGDKFRCHWVIPVPARFPAGETAARIFGYYCVNRNGTLDGLGGASTSGQARGWGGNNDIVSRLEAMEMAEYGELSTDDDGLIDAGDVDAEAVARRWDGVRDGQGGHAINSAV